MGKRNSLSICFTAIAAVAECFITIFSCFRFCFWQLLLLHWLHRSTVRFCFLQAMHFLSQLLLLYPSLLAPPYTAGTIPNDDKSISSLPDGRGLFIALITVPKLYVHQTSNQYRQYWQYSSACQFPPLSSRRC